MLIINQSNLELRSHNGFQNYETGKIYLLGCRITPSRVIPAKITEFELKNKSGDTVNLNNELFRAEYYWDTKANIGAITIAPNDLDSLKLLPLSAQPIKDRDGNYALVVAIKPIKDFESKLYKDYYFKIEYKVMGVSRTLKFMPFN